jgi:hypothetical protein
MTKIYIPKNLGECRIVIAKAGNYAVWNNKTGRNKLMIPCRDEAHAKDILRQLKENDHAGIIYA